VTVTPTELVSVNIRVAMGAFRATIADHMAAPLAYQQSSMKGMAGLTP
jgi:hypothetical protein